MCIRDSPNAVDPLPVSITNSTISGNSSGSISNSNALEIGNTIVIRTGTDVSILNGTGGSVSSLGHNLSNDNGGGFLTGPGDLINTDPLLGPLQNNGGPTFTHELLKGSPAINAGDPKFTPPPFADQRGYQRVYNGRIDIGSLEVQPVPTPTPTPCEGTIIFSENFDSVTAPALPSGWVASNPDPGDGTMWVTSTSSPDTPPNSAFVPDQDGISDKVLDRPGVTITSGNATMRFRNKFDTEFSDGEFCGGGMLEVSSPNISGAAFLDITDTHVGGIFVSGGYNAELGTSCGNALAGRLAWAASSKGYIDTVINLGPNLAGQTVTFRFRMGTDEAVAAPGVHLS